MIPHCHSSSYTQDNYSQSQVLLVPKSPPPAGRVPGRKKKDISHFPREIPLLFYPLHQALSHPCRTWTVFLPSHRCVSHVKLLVFPFWLTLFCSLTSCPKEPEFSFRKMCCYVICEVHPLKMNWKTSGFVVPPYPVWTLTHSEYFMWEWKTRRKRDVVVYGEEFWTFPD